MNKYHVYLADNYTSSQPFITDWDYELIGDKLRAEFDEYFEEQERLAKSGAGKTKQLFKGEYVKKFMTTKRINIIDDPANGSLKSVFILKKGEKKVVDKRAKDNLAYRFEYVRKTDKDGNKLEPLGFMKFELIEGVEETPSKRVESLQVDGNDIEYFEEEAKEIEEKKEFVCEICGKSFDSNRGLHAHSLSHNKK